MLRQFIRDVILETTGLDGTYSDATGEWSVATLVGHVRDLPVVEIPIASLENNLEPSEEERTDERPGSPDFVRRAMRADLSYPIIVVSYPDGLGRGWGPPSLEGQAPREDDGQSASNLTGDPIPNSEEGCIM